MFSGRFLQTRVYDKSVNHGGRFPTINIDHVVPPLSILETIQSLFNGLDNTNVNVYTFGNQTVSLTDSWDMYSFDKKSLQNATFIKAKLPDSLPWIYNKMAIQSVAHPMREYGSSATITVAIIGVDSVPFFGPSLNVIRAHCVENMELIASIPVERPMYMHSFAVSQNYVILITDPIFINVIKYLQQGAGNECFEILSSVGTWIYVVSTQRGDVKKIHVPMAKFHGHHINAFEKGSNIYIDVIVTPNVDILNSWRLNIMRNETQRRKIVRENILKRYVINLESESFYESNDFYSNALTDRLELPVINEQYRFKEYCFVYGIVNGLYPENQSKHNHYIRKNINVTRTDFATTIIVRKDLCNGNDLMWYNESHFPSEAQFVPNPDAQSEDDGVLLSVVLDGVRKVSYFLILDARTFDEIAREETPFIVPFTIHGMVFE